MRKEWKENPKNGKTIWIDNQIKIKNSDNLRKYRKYSNDLINISQKHAHKHPRSLSKYSVSVTIGGKCTSISQDTIVRMTIKIKINFGKITEKEEVRHIV